MLRTNFVRKVAVDLLKMHGYQPPVPIEELVMKLGLGIREVNVNADIDAKFSNEKMIITVNAAQTNPYRRRFSIAHELGHFVLKHYLNPWEYEDPETGKSFVESEADEFAGSILMPKDFLLKQLKSGTTIIDLQKMCEVSHQAIWVRIQIYGLTKFLKS